MGLRPNKRTKYDGRSVDSILKSGVNKYWSGNVNRYNMTTNLVFSDPNIYQVVKIEIRKGLIDQSDNQGSSVCILFRKRQ